MAFEAVERAMSEAQAAGGVPGLTAAVRLPDASVWSGAFGHRGIGDAPPMTSDTLFWIASMTKAITSLAALQLVEQGRVSLDQPASDFVPAIASALILDGFGANGEARLRAATRPVTLRHLLTHTSGYGYAFCNPDLARLAASTGQADPMELPRVFEAGEGWQYGVSTDFAGQVIEAVSGQSLDIYLKEQVFDVLGMADTTFAPSPDQLARMAQMHARLPDGSLAPTEFRLPPAPNPMLGGGGLYSTADDYLRFLTALLNGGAGPGGRRLLEPESMGLLTDNQVGELQCGRLESALPAMSNTFEPMPGVAKRWSLGFLRNQTPGPDGRSAGSLAWAGLSNCYYWLDPAAGVAGVILMQLLPFADPRALEIFAAFERAVYT